jgi:hypothetical protein
VLSDYKIYQIKNWGGAWTVSYVSSHSNGVGQNYAFTCLAIGDLNADGANELYAGSSDGHIYQIKWNGSTWSSLAINSTSVAANKLAIGDGDNDGQDELYVAAQDNHAYEFKWTGIKFQMTDLGNAGTTLCAVAIGDGDNTGQYKVYAMGTNAHLFQFQPVSQVTATPTPALSMTPTPLPTATPAPTGIPDSEKKLKVLHSQINPVRGEQARIRWYQAGSAPVTLTIYNLLGDKIISLAENRIFASGQFQFIPWDGKTSKGAMAGSGIYIVYFQCGDDKEQSKVAVVK